MWKAEQETETGVFFRFPGRSFLAQTEFMSNPFFGYNPSYYTREGDYYRIAPGPTKIPLSFFSNHSGKKPFEAIQIDGGTQVLWPPHCVQGTESDNVLVDNNLFQAIVKKG